MKLIYCLISISIFISCAKPRTEKNDNPFYTVPLIKSEGYGPFVRILKPFGTYTSSDNFSGIPPNEKHVIQYLRFTSSNLLKDLFDKNIINQEEFNNFIQGVNAVSGINEDYFFSVLDLNNNDDFSDDPMFKFNLQIKDSLKSNFKFRDSLSPTVLIKYDHLTEKNTIFKDSIHVKVFPYKDYFIYHTETNFNNLSNELQLVAQVNEFWYGSFEINQKKFEIAISQDLSRPNIVTRLKDSQYISTSDPKYLQQAVKDTFKLPYSDIYISIDSLDVQNKKLTLRTIEPDSLFYGYNIGSHLSDFNFRDIAGNNFSFYSLLNENDYVLMDFWGTWCVPCLELTPDLKSIDQKFNNLSLLGIAYRSNVDEVQDYLEKNEISWPNFIQDKDNNKIVNKLKINTYPTFILIDKTGKIIYRGVGKNALKEIENILNK